MTESRDQLADALVDRYRLEQPLGRDASATVYLAQDVRHGRRVALKVLHAALGQAVGVERFQPAELDHPGRADERSTVGAAPGPSRLRHPDGNHALTVTRRLVH